MKARFMLRWLAGNSAAAMASWIAPGKECIQPMSIAGWRYPEYRRRSLLSNAMQVWNTIEMAKIVERLRASGEEIATVDLAKVSPMAFHHIIPNGMYYFRGAKRRDDIEYNALE